MSTTQDNHLLQQIVLWRFFLINAAYMKLSHRTAQFALSQFDHKSLLFFGRDGSKSRRGSSDKQKYRISNNARKIEKLATRHPNTDKQFRFKKFPSQFQSISKWVPSAFYSMSCNTPNRPTTAPMTHWRKSRWWILIQFQPLDVA